MTTQPATNNDNTDDARQAFLADAGWADAAAATLAGDASSRSYQRLRLGDRKAVLMIAPPGAEEMACPKGASPEARAALGYNAMARLAGPNLHAFVDVAKALTSVGLSAPGIYAADAKHGFALIEDLGDDLFARIVAREDEQTLYRAAADALYHLHTQTPERPDAAEYAMLDYDKTALLTEAMLLIDWYWPLKKSTEISDALRQEYLALWNMAVDHLSEPQVMVLRDFHAENLLWMPNRTGVSRVGLIDFQDALIGHAAYDLASLLEDARRDVSPALASDTITHYLQHTDKTTHDQFFVDYAILAAQRNAKILGIFARLAKRDNKPQYLNLLPRVEDHFRGDLARPGLEPLSGFFKKHLPDLTT